MNAFLNENWKSVMDEISPFVHETIRGIVVGITKKFFTKIPISEILLA